MSELADTHAHLQEQEFESDRDAAIARAQAVGVQTIIIPGVDLKTSRAGIELAERHAGVFATVGYHPHEASGLTAEDAQEIERLLAHPKVVAVGEIGLDFYRMHSPRDTQIEVFEAMLALAERSGMPVVIHCRDAWDALAPLLEPWARRVMGAYAGRPLGVLHYFSSDVETARRYVDLGFLISVHTSVTHPKARQLREVAAVLPLKSLVVETDSPYGAPQAYRGRRNEPAFVLEAAKAVGEVKGIVTEEVAATTTANARRLFRIDAHGRVADARRDAVPASSSLSDGPEGPSLRPTAARRDVALAASEQRHGKHHRPYAERQGPRRE